MVAPKITKEELKRKLDMDDDFVLLDVRNPVDYGKSDIKITGGLRIPLDELEARLSELDPDREVVAYCTWVEEHSSARAAQILLNKGFRKASALLGGFNAWVDAGLPVEKK